MNVSDEIIATLLTEAKRREAMAAASEAGPIRRDDLQIADHLRQAASILESNEEGYNAKD